MNGQQPQASILSTLQPVMGALWALFCFTQDGVSSVRYVFIISIRDFARHILNILIVEPWMSYQRSDLLRKTMFRGYLTL